MQRSQVLPDASVPIPAPSSPAAVAATDRSRATPVGVVGLLAAGATTGVLTWALGRLVLDLGRGALPWDAAGGWTVAASLRVEDLVGLGAALLGTGLAAWFCLGFLIAAGCAAARAAGYAWLVGERLVGRAAPVLVRRALVLSAGTGVALAGAGLPAVAMAPPPPDDLGWAVTTERWPAAAPDAAPPAGGVVPSPTATPDVHGTTGTPVSRTAAAPVTGTRAATAPAAADVVVVVRPGDTLWDIADDHLPDGATVADVAAAWPTWYAANTDVIGPDPDLIVPGQRLVAPAAPAAGTTDGADR